MAEKNKENSGSWGVQQIPDQSGKIVIVTGPGGLGYETALALAEKGAEVILAGRSEEKGKESVAKIRGLHPKAKIKFALLDLAKLSSIADFARRFAGEHSALHILINNAGVMAPPKRKTTFDGFELQFGTNYLGHYALTAQLLPLLKQTKDARIVNVSSLAHRQGTIRLNDLQWEQGYRPWASYGQSKLANLIFALELQRRSDAQGWGVMSNAAHPGFARTELIAKGPGLESILSKIGMYIQPWISQSAAEGALPTLFAATSPEARGGAYYGPNGFNEIKGAPTAAKISKTARDEATAKKLWEVSEKLTHIRWN